MLLPWLSLDSDPPTSASQAAGFTSVRHRAQLPDNFHAQANLNIELRLYVRRHRPFLTPGQTHKERRQLGKPGWATSHYLAPFRIIKLVLRGGVRKVMGWLRQHLELEGTWWEAGLGLLMAIVRMTMLLLTNIATQVSTGICMCQALREVSQQPSFHR
jgi:hypothetical protein